MDNLMTLAEWERELLRAVAHREGEGDVIFTRTDGKSFKIENVRVDSIGPSAANPGVIAVEFFDTDDVTHVPFVLTWKVEYRL